MCKLMVFLALILPIFAQAQIPTTDVLTQINLAMNQARAEVQWNVQNNQDIQKVAQLIKIYDQTVRTYQQAVSTYQSLTGIRGWGLVYSVAPGARSLFPQSYGGRTATYYGELGRRVALANSSNAVMPSGQLMQMPPALTSFVNQTRQLNATAQATANMTYERATERAELYSVFVTKDCEDMKCEAAKANRIAAEQLMLQNERIQNDALERAIGAERAAALQQQHETFLQSIGSIKNRRVVAHPLPE